MSKKILITSVIIIVIIGLGLYLMLNSNKISSNSKSNSTNGTTYEIQGMKVEILKNGSGVPAKVDDRVTTHYVGTFQNGKEFDSSIGRNEPFTFQLGADKVIKGWDLGLVGMKVGETRRLTIPYELAYGADGYPPFIPPKTTLIFEITLLSIN